MLILEHPGGAAAHLMVLHKSCFDKDGESPPSTYNKPHPKYVDWLIDFQS
jgi:hypothetical protein